MENGSNGKYGEERLMEHTHQCAVAATCYVDSEPFNKGPFLEGEDAFLKNDVIELGKLLMYY